MRAAVGPAFPIGVKLNVTDPLEGGVTLDDATVTVALLEDTSVDLITLSGGAYYLGAGNASDRGGRGPYFLSDALSLRRVTTTPLLLLGGIKTRAQAEAVLASGAADMVGLARGLVLDPDLPRTWTSDQPTDPAFPRFDNPPPRAVTAWYTERIWALGGEPTPGGERSARATLTASEARRARNLERWRAHFGGYQSGGAVIDDTLPQRSPSAPNVACPERER